MTRALFEDLALVIASVYATIPLFWFTVHPFTARWRARGRHSYKLILPLWLLYIVLAIAALWPWRNQALYPTPLTFIPGSLLILTGLLIYRASARNFTHVQLSGLAELEPDRHRQQLVTTGIRSRIRHPIYCGHLCELLGWTLAFGTISLFVLAVFAILTGAVMLRLEDNELEQRFGASYREYRTRVPAILPRFK